MCRPSFQTPRARGPWTHRFSYGKRRESRGPVGAAVKFSGCGEAFSPRHSIGQAASADLISALMLHLPWRIRRSLAQKEGFMKIRSVALLLGVSSLAVVLTVGVAAQGRGGPANYSVAGETSVKGTVEELKPGPNQGMHVMLKTSATTLELALGPSW